MVVRRKKPVAEMNREELIEQNEALVAECEALRAELDEEAGSPERMFAAAKRHMRNADATDDLRMKVYHLRRSTEIAMQLVHTLQRG